MDMAWERSSGSLTGTTLDGVVRNIALPLSLALLGSVGWSEKIVQLKLCFVNDIDITNVKLLPLSHANTACGLAGDYNGRCGYIA